MRISKTINSFGTASMIDFGRKHAAKLATNTNPEVTTMVPLLSAKVRKLEKAYAERRPLVKRWVEASQANDMADDDLDTDISVISYELLGPKLSNGDRNNDMYRALFPDGNIGFINGSIEQELAHVDSMVDYLRDHPKHPMASWAPILKRKAAVLKATVEPKEVAELMYKEALDKEQYARAALARVLRKSVFVVRAEMRDSTVPPPAVSTPVNEMNQNF